MLDLPHEVAGATSSPLYTWMPAGTLHVDIGLPRRPAVGHVDPVRHRRRLAHPPLLDRLHARRPALQPLLRVPEPVRRLDAGARPRLELPRHLPRLGGRRSLLVPARLVLVRAQLGRGGGQEGVRHQPRRRLRLHARDVPDLRDVGSLDYAAMARRCAHDLAAAPPPRSRCCSSSARSARARRSRCTSGCPTRWRARPRCRRSSTPPRWSPRACSCSCRAHAFLDVSSDAMTVVAWVGGITALFAGTVAHRRSPTSSACSRTPPSASSATCSSPSASVRTPRPSSWCSCHAFFKGCLFLGAGSVIHGNARRAGHAGHGPVPQVHADHRGRVGGRVARDRGRAAVLGLLVEGRDPQPRRSCATTTASGSSASSPRCSPRST